MPLFVFKFMGLLLCRQGTRGVAHLPLPYC